MLTLIAVMARARSGGAASTDGPGGASWGPKLVAVEEIPERAQFRPLMPTAVPEGLRFVGAQLVWVQQDEDDLRLRSRQSVRLVYRGRKRDTEVSITEAEHLAGVEARDNTWQMISQGYFEADQGMHSLLSLGTRNGVDFLIVTNGLSQAEVARLGDSLAPMKVTVGGRGAADVGQ